MSFGTPNAGMKRPRRILSGKRIIANYRALYFVWTHGKCAGARQFDNGPVPGFYCPVHEQGVLFE